MHCSIWLLSSRLLPLLHPELPLPLLPLLLQPMAGPAPAVQQIQANSVRTAAAQDLLLTAGPVAAVLSIRVNSAQSAAILSLPVLLSTSVTSAAGSLLIRSILPSSALIAVIPSLTTIRSDRSKADISPPFSILANEERYGIS